MENTVLTESYEWQALKNHYEEIKFTHLREIFNEDTDRGERLNLKAAGLYFDYSKNRITNETIKLLLDLAKSRGVKPALKAMFSGEHINETEDRSVLHTALRNRSGKPVLVDGTDVMPCINEVLDRMSQFSKSLRSGEWKGYTGKKICNVVNIGIGGGELGPAMASGGVEY